MIKEKIKSLISDEKSGGVNKDKKKLENLIIFVIILVITVIAINYIWNKDNEKSDDERYLQNEILASNEKVETDENIQYDLEKRLEKILESMEGVGDVKVLINYSETSTVVAMYNENITESSTEESDNDGGIRTILETDTKKEIVYSENDGNSKPVTEKVIMPQIEGVIITAEGASNAKVKNNIIEAVKAATGIASHKIQVFEKRK